jgi:hypothetical protein
VTVLQIGLRRLEGTADSYQPGTLPLRLYQRNPFSMQRKDDEIGAETYELTACETPATTQEVQDIEDEEAEDIALS